MRNPTLGNEMLSEANENSRAVARGHEEGDGNLTKGKKSRDIRNIEAEER